MTIIPADTGTKRSQEDMGMRSTGMRSTGTAGVISDMAIPVEEDSMLAAYRVASSAI